MPAISQAGFEPRAGGLRHMNVSGQPLPLLAGPLLLPPPRSTVISFPAAASQRELLSPAAVSPLTRKLSAVSFK